MKRTKEEQRDERKRGGVIYRVVGQSVAVPCIDSTLFQSADEWLIFCPQIYGNTGRQAIS